MPAQSFARVLAGRAKLFAREQSCDAFQLRGSLLRPYPNDPVSWKQVAVLSLARLRQEFYGLPPNRPLFLMRIRKEVLHELGHTAGLTHCDDRLCTMALSTNIQQLDAKGSDFCDGCSVLLREGIADAGLRASPGETT
jgi:hypothetical protein